jgi:hypothetical protein
VIRSISGSDVDSPDVSPYAALCGSIAPLPTAWLSFPST